MPTDKMIPAWYVLHTKSRFESVVQEGLQKKTIEVFLPKIIVPSRRKDRKKMIRVPLFPGYLFVHSDLHPHHHIEIVKTAGAVKLISDKQGPLSVADDTIHSLQIMVASDQPIVTGTFFTKGDKVIVANGPFSGVIGTFERYHGMDRVIVYIDALGQFAAVEVNAEDVERAPTILA